MLRVSYIGVFNQTNGLIHDLLETLYSATITFFKPQVVLKDTSLLLKNPFDLIIYDLNTSSGFGKAPQNISLITNSTEGAPLLVLHPYDNEKFIVPLIKAGADGVLSLAPSEEELSEAVDHLLNNKTYPPHLRKYT